MYNTNFITGIPGLVRDGKWCYRFRFPSRAIWEGKNTLTVLSEGVYADGDVRLQYVFHEDRIVLKLIPPTNPTLDQTMWLGNFDALGAPRHNGTQKAPHEPIVGDLFFFPHPVYRQGLLLELPPKSPLQHRGTAVEFPLKAAQEVVLRFVAPEEVPAGLK
jgi:hypothetical protein